MLGGEIHVFLMHRLWAVELGGVKAGADIWWFAVSWGLRQVAPSEGPNPAGAKSLTMTALLSQAMIPHRCRQKTLRVRFFEEGASPTASSTPFDSGEGDANSCEI